MKASHNKTKKLFAVMRGLILVGILVFIWDAWESIWGFSQKMERNSPGEGSYQEEMKISSKYFSGDYEVEVKERQLTKEQVKQLFSNARKEIDKDFLGENKDLNHVYQKVNLKTRYQDGLVRARWSFDQDDLIDNEGEIQHVKVQETTMVQAIVELRYGEYTDIYEFFFRVIPADKKSEKGFLNSLSKTLAREDAEEEWMKLPGEIDGEKVKWRKKLSYRGIALIALGWIGCWLIPWAEKWEAKKQMRESQQAMLLDYPSILNQLSLLLGVGISLPDAVNKIVTRYEEKKQKTSVVLPGYELLAVMNREMKDGVGTLKAINNFGRNSNRKEYRKLALLLQQNIRKGNAHVVEMMEKEDMEAFELRKSLARKAGEEASTKLLVPMVGMLGIVIVILVVPAMFKLGIS